MVQNKPHGYSIFNYTHICAEIFQIRGIDFEVSIRNQAALHLYIIKKIHYKFEESIWLDTTGLLHVLSLRCGHGHTLPAGGRLILMHKHPGMRRTEVSHTCFQLRKLFISRQR